MRSHSLTQYEFFDYFPNDISEYGDLQKLNAVLEQIPYKDLLIKLDAERKNGRDDYPYQTMFFILVAQFLFERLDPTSIRRELSGNPSLRWLVGISDKEKVGEQGHLVPPSSAFSHFYDRLISHQADLDDIFARLRRTVYDEIPNVGVRVSGDGKYFDSFTPNAHAGEISPTRRAEHDATYSKKSYAYYASDGIRHTKNETHYGFRKHTIVDSTTELPLGSILTRTNDDEKKVTMDLIRSMPSYVMKKMQYATYDRGYDSGAFVNFLRDYHVRPIVDKRKMWHGEPLRQYRDNNAYYTEAGDVYFIDEDGNSEINLDTGYWLLQESQISRIRNRSSGHALSVWQPGCSYLYPRCTSDI